MIKMPKKSKDTRFKHYERKIKSPFIIYSDFESILDPEENGKQNLDESYTNKYRKHVAYSYDHELVFFDDNSRNPFKSYLGGHAIDNIMNSMLEENKNTGVM